MASAASGRGMIMAKCTGKRCPMQVGYKVNECNHKDCPYRTEPITNADRVRAMSDEELADFLTDINPTNCQDCAFSHGWRCQPDRDDYSGFEKCKEGRKRWLQQPQKGE